MGDKGAMGALAWSMAMVGNWLVEGHGDDDCGAGSDDDSVDGKNDDSDDGNKD